MAKDSQKYQEFEIDVRINAASEAQSRTRWCLLAVAIVSLGILVTQWNAYFS